MIFKKNCTIFVSIKGVIMIVKFDKEYLSELYYEGKCSDKKHRYQPDIVKRYKQRIDVLNTATCIEALYKLHSLGYEVLTGDKAGISSIRVNNKYRIEFIVSYEEDNKALLTICNIIELSNHYK